MIQEGYTDPTIIPPILSQLKGTKIFIIQFRLRGAFIDAVIVRTFDDDVRPMLLPTPTIKPSEKIPPSSVSINPDTPQLEGKKKHQKDNLPLPNLSLKK